MAPGAVESPWLRGLSNNSEIAPPPSGGLLNFSMGRILKLASGRACCGVGEYDNITNRKSFVSVI